MPHHDHFQIKRITKTEFEQGTTLSESATGTHTFYALECYVLINFENTKRKVSAYYIPCEGKLVVNSQEDIAHACLSYLIYELIGSDNFFKVDAFQKWFGTYDWGMPTNSTECESTFFEGVTKMESVQKGFIENTPIPEGLIETISRITKFDHQRINELDRMISTALLIGLPLEHQHSYLFLSEVCTVSLGEQILFLLADDSTLAEKNHAKKEIITIFTVLTREIFKNMGLHGLALFSAVQSTNVIFSHVFDYFLRLSPAESTNLQDKIIQLVPLAIEITLKKKNGNESNNEIAETIIRQLESTPLAQKFPLKKWLYSTVKKAVKTISTEFDKPATDPMTLAHQLCKSDLEGKDEEQQRHLLFAKLTEINAGRAVHASVTQENNFRAPLAIQLNAILAQLKYRQLCQQYSTKSKVSFISAFFSKQHHAVLKAFHVLEKKIIDYMDAAKQNRPIVHHEDFSRAAEIADIDLLLRSVLASENHRLAIQNSEVNLSKPIG